jgi:hypothetical protein
VLGALNRAGAAVELGSAQAEMTEAQCWCLSHSISTFAITLVVGSLAQDDAQDGKEMEMAQNHIH